VSDPSLTQLPADSLLLAGDCIINESMLTGNHDPDLLYLANAPTGESIPVSKIPVSDEALALLDPSAASIHPILARHFLFCGTKIIRARRPQDVDDDEAVALAMVVRTGFNTTKGALVRSMLFPKPFGFKFYRDSFRYISVMACIAVVGFVASFVNFIRLGMAWHFILIRALDLITIVVPPALPATLTIGTNFALARLRKRNIFCISPQRVNISGKLDVVCFDKTGTLTEDGLDVLGIRLVQHPEIRFSDLFAEAGDILPSASYERDPTVDYRINKQILYTMATCHSLRLVDDELVGDPLDLKMFEFTGWSFDEGEQQQNGFAEEGQGTHSAPPIARPPTGMEYDLEESQATENPLPVELGILRSFEFVAHLRRASVVVRQRGDPGATILREDFV
jgi:cation-transporting P-type ATPase 13A2